MLRTIMEGSIKYEEIKAEGLADFYMEKKRKEEISLPDLVDGEGNVIGKGTLNKNGKVEGMRVLYLAEGKIENVILKMEKNGYCATYFKNGEIESETYYEDNKREGSYKKYNENGLLLERGHFEKGKAEGYWNNYHIDGSRFTGPMKNGVRVGAWQEFDNRQRVISKGEMKEGQKEGESIAYEYKKDLKDPVSKKTTYYKAGDYFNSILESYSEKNERVISTINKDGKKNGLYQVFNKNNMLIAQGFYKDDQLHGEYEEFNSDGKLVKRSIYGLGILQKLRK